MKWHQITASAVCLMLFSFSAPATVRYVDLNCTNAMSPYLDWSTAATNIQDAINASSDGDLIFVTNGVYATGGQVVYGSLTNRIVINKAVTVQSVNGPILTIIQGNRVLGDSAVRCAYLTNNAVLIGFTLVNGATRSFSVGADLLHEKTGGGFWCEPNSTAVLSNCIIAGNLAFSYGGGGAYGTLNNCIIQTNFVGGGASGGGVFSSTLNNCVLIGNIAANSGGGAESSTLNNCTVSNNLSSSGTGGGADSSTLNNCALLANTNLTGFSGGGGASYSSLSNCILIGNSATRGGGASGGTSENCTFADNLAKIEGGGTYLVAAMNCVIYGNTALIGSNSNYSGGTLRYSCISPLTNGVGNITNEPGFANLANGDFHLQSNSPCINAGNNVYITITNDFDGNLRIRGCTVDIGAYEYQAPVSVLSYAWAQQYGLPRDGTADYADLDGDGMSNWQEWKAGTIPTNATSLLQLASPYYGGNGVIVTWQSVNTRTYYLQRSTNLNSQPAFSSILSNLAGQAGTTSRNDFTATNGGPYFYRVGVQ